MVSFQCESCGDTVKKPKLENHYARCYAPFVCIDCSTTFNSPGEWKGHVSCISEAEKYQKALYKGPKKNDWSRPSLPGKYEQNGRGGFRPSLAGPVSRASGTNCTPLGTPLRMVSPSSGQSSTQVAASSNDTNQMSDKKATVPNGKAGVGAGEQVNGIVWKPEKEAGGRNGVVHKHRKVSAPVVEPSENVAGNKQKKKQKKDKAAPPPEAEANDMSTIPSAQGASILPANNASAADAQDPAAVKKGKKRKERAVGEDAGDETAEPVAKEQRKKSKGVALEPPSDKAPAEPLPSPIPALSEKKKKRNQEKGTEDAEVIVISPPRDPPVPNGSLGASGDSVQINGPAKKKKKVKGAPATAGEDVASKTPAKDTEVVTKKRKRGADGDGDGKSKRGKRRLEASDVAILA